MPVPHPPPPLLGLALALVPAAASADGIDSPMYRDPALELPKVVRTFPPGLAERWLAALDRPEAELQAQAASAIALAHERGMPGLAAAVGPLTRVLERADQSPAARAAAARALVALEARDTAPSLSRHAADTPELRELVEPALARWDYRPVRAVWLRRVAEPPPWRRSHVLAVQALAAVREGAAADALRAAALSDRHAGPHRLEAARALGALRTAGSEGDAEKLAADPSPRGVPARLAAASLLRHHSGDAAARLLQALARDPEPAVAAAALTRLVEIDPRLVPPVLPAAFASPGADVRGLGVSAIGRLPTADHVKLLGGRLADAHPDVREQARRALRDFADRPSLRAAVIEEGGRVLAAADWRGQEQAAVLLGQLGHKPAAPRLVELLRADRPEPAIAAAWALRVLAVPDALPAALAHVRLRHGQLLSNGRAAGLRAYSPEQVDAQLTQLAQWFGAAGYEPADPELRTLFPRILQAGMPPGFSPVGPETRAAALWALGRLHAGDAGPALVGPVEQRLTGDGAMGPDDPRVRRMAAVALGRMGARSSLPALRTEAGGDRPTLDPVAQACRWALAQLTGAPPPPPGVYEVPQRDWFLVPVK
jgi:HEAT repeat protein